MALTVATLLGVAQGNARADAASYSSERRQVRACVLVSNASLFNGVPENYVPHVFYILDRRTDLKPNGWEFVNPLAPGTITSDIYTRWRRRDISNVDPAFQTGSAQSSLFRIGAPLDKKMGAYWEVNLDTIGQDDLQQFDVVLIASRNNAGVTFTAEQRDKLRRFVDAGGTIWLEDEGGLSINNRGPFIIDVNFTGAPLTGTPQLNTSHHPLVNFPFGLAESEVANLGMAGVARPHRTHINPVLNAPVDFHFVQPIILQSGKAMVSAGDFGAGHIIISSASIAAGINNPAGGANIVGPNSGAISGDTFLATLPSDLKFAYNLTAWTSSIPTHGVNTRRTGGSRENIGGELGRKWQTPATTAAPSGDGSGAVIHKGVVFWVDGNNILHAYDANPGQDLDNDNNADDGIPDLIYGAPFDEIWRVDLKTLNIPAGVRVATPTIVSFNDVGNVLGNGAGPGDIVTVAASNGVTLAFDAFPRSSAGRLLPAPAKSPLWSVYVDTTNDATGKLVDGHDFKIPGPSPAFSEGILFTVVSDAGVNSANNPWRVVAVDPTTGRSIFDGTSIAGSAGNTSGITPATLFNNVLGLPAVTGPLNVGYVRDQATGALDKMVYVQTRPFNNTGSESGGGQVVGCWFSTKQEPLMTVDSTVPHTRYRASGERGRIPWWLPNGPQNGIDLRPVVYIQYAAGGVARLALGTDFTVTYEGPAPNRELVVTLKVGLADGDKVFADYTVDWANGVITPSPNSQPNTPQPQEVQRFISRRFSVPSPVPNMIFPIAGTAMTSDDIMIVNSSDFPGFDKVYAVRDQFPTSALGPAARASRMVWSWGPNGPSDTTNPTDPDSSVGINGLKPRLINTDKFGLNIAANLVATDLELIGSPAVSNGVVYEVGFCHMKDGGGTGQTEFNAAIILALRTNPDTTFTLTQNGSPVKFDTSGSGQPLVTLEQIDLVNSKPGNPRFIQLFENVNFTVDRFSSSVHLTDMRAANNGDTFNTAMPIYVRIGATRLNDPIVNPNTGFGPLDNLLWWSIIPIDKANVLKLPSDYAQVTADIMPNSGVTVVGDTLYFGTDGGSVVSFDITGVQNSGGQVNMARDNGALRIHRRAAIVDVDGITPIANNPIITPPLATTGILVVGTPRGLVALDNQVTLIADNHRLIEVDRAGRAVHSIDASQSVSTSGAAVNGPLVTTRTSFDRPSIARRVGLNEYLVCDTGNNRVVQMSHGGVVSWELHGFNNDMHFLNPGVPLTLNQPTDVQSYTESGVGPLTLVNPTTKVTYTRPAGYYFITHYIIADSGNYRGLEIIDVVDAVNNPVTVNGSDGTTVLLSRQVVFVTRSLGEQNRNLRYRTMQQFTAFDTTTNQVQQFMVSAVDNQRLGVFDATTQAVGNTSVDGQGPGSGIAIIKRNPFGAGDGDVTTIINNIAFLDANGKVAVDPSGNVLRQAIAHPTYFREFEDVSFDAAGNRGVTTQKYLMADANGVYLLRPSSGTDQTQAGNALAGREALVEWMLTSQDYLLLTGRPLRATSVQKLQDADPYTDATGAVIGYKPRFLIANGFSGLDSVGQVFNDNRVLPGELRGEVFEIKSLDYYQHKTNNLYDGYRAGAKNTALYYTAPSGLLASNPISSIVWMVPKETLPGANAAGTPLVRSIQRKIGDADGGTATYLLDQPSSASRPF